jgi:hypothetical protein
VLTRAPTFTPTLHIDIPLPRRAKFLRLIEDAIDVQSNELKFDPILANDLKLSDDPFSTASSTLALAENRANDRVEHVLAI